MVCEPVIYRDGDGHLRVFQLMPETVQSPSRDLSAGLNLCLNQGMWCPPGFKACLSLLELIDQFEQVIERTAEAITL